ncbi:hypothetical protein GGR53DRAFT_485706, partial [Hypoxylon sp. FL1150]
MIAFIAVQCFNLPGNQAGNSTRNDNSLFHGIPNDDLEVEAFTSYARIERDIRKGSTIWRTDKTKWRNIMKLGGQLSPLMKDYGGESFLILFPLYELGVSIEEKLTSIHSFQYAWDMIRSLLQHTGLGELFRSLSSAVGNLLISRFRTRGSADRSFMTHIAPVFEKYLLKGISEHSPRLVMDKPVVARWAPIAVCGNRNHSYVHLSEGLSLYPWDLLTLINEDLNENVVHHLIRQELPYGWRLLKREETCKTADKAMLLDDFDGYIIPLCIDGGWCLVCYVNPMRSETTHPITFIDPRKSKQRHTRVLDLLADWISRDQGWVPKEIDAQSTKVVDVQTTRKQESGIHVILHAVSMAKAGQPECRPMNEKMCRDFRVRHFVTLLNEVHQEFTEVASKKDPEVQQLAPAVAKQSATETAKRPNSEGAEQSTAHVSKKTKRERI